MKGKRFFSIVTAVVMVLSMCIMLPVKTVVPLEANALSNSEIQSKLIKILYGGSGGRVNCDFDGYVNTSGRHEGIDFAKSAGTTVYSLINGTVTRVTNSSSSSTLSTLAIYDNVNDKTVIYLHTANISVNVGDNIRQGQAVAIESNRGATAAHTHVEVRNGRQTAASKSVNDYTLDNPNPYPYWEIIVNGEETGHVMSQSEAAGQTIPNGDYWICSAMDNTYFLDIPGQEIGTQGTNVWMWNYGDDMPSVYDVWTVTYLNNGFYRIKQKNSGLSLDVDGGTLSRGANVQLWSDNESNAQQWSIAATGQGFTLQTRCSGYYMDIYDGSTENGTNVSTYSLNGNAWQRWNFIPYNTSERPLADGLYNIQTVCNTAYYVDAEGAHGEFKNETNIILFNSTADSFRIKYAGDGWYQIYEASSGLALDLNMIEGQNVQLYTDHSGRGQYWKIRKTSDGHYLVISKANGWCLDLDHGVAENNTNILTFNYNGGTNQKWNFVPVTLSGITVTAPTKKTYNVGEALNTSGMKVIAKYTDTSTKDVTKSVKVSGDLSTAGTKTITVSYTEGSVTKTGTFKITVNAVTTTTARTTTTTTTTKATTTTTKATTTTTKVTTTKATTTSSTTTVTTAPALALEETEVTLKNGEQYAIKANQSNLTYKSNNTDVAIVSKNGVLTAVGEGVAIISVINSDSDVVQLKVKVVSSGGIKGDINDDGKVNVADIVLLQKYLLGSQKITEEQWKIADLNNDGLADVFDLVMMRRILIERE